MSKSKKILLISLLLLLLTVGSATAVYEIGTTGQLTYTSNYNSFPATSYSPVINYQAVSFIDNGGRPTVKSHYVSPTTGNDFLVDTQVGSLFSGYSDTAQTILLSGWVVSVAERDGEIYLFSDKLGSSGAITQGDSFHLYTAGYAGDPEIARVDADTVVVGYHDTFNNDCAFRTFDVDSSTGSISQKGANTGVSSNGCYWLDMVIIDSTSRNVGFAFTEQTGSTGYRINLGVMQVASDGSYIDDVDMTLISSASNPQHPKLLAIDSNTLALQYTNQIGTNLIVKTYDFSVGNIGSLKDTQLIDSSAYHHDIAFLDSSEDIVVSTYSQLSPSWVGKASEYTISSSGMISSVTDTMTYSDDDVIRVASNNIGTSDTTVVYYEDQSSVQSKMAVLKAGECDPVDLCCDSSGYFLPSGTTSTCGNCQQCTGTSSTCSNVAAGTDPGSDCSVTSWSCTGFGSPYTCSRERLDGYCDGYGNCREETDHITYGYVCSGGNEVLGSSTYYSSTDSSDRCSAPSTPSSGFGDREFDVFACAGNGGTIGPDVGDDTISCGSGCCYDQGSTTMCVSSGSSSYNFYDFSSTYDGTATDYCSASVVVDCNTDSDCQNYATCSAGSCVNGFGTSSVYGASWIDPAFGSSTVATTEDLLGYCNIDNSDSLTGYYSYQWYNGSSLYSSGVSASGITPGVDTLVNTLSSATTASGDEWIFSCQFTTVVGPSSSSWYNSSTVTISPDPVPNTEQPTITPTTAYDATNLEFNCSGTDPNSEDLGFYWELYNGTSLYDSGAAGSFSVSYDYLLDTKMYEGNRQLVNDFVSLGGGLFATTISYSAVYTLRIYDITNVGLVTGKDFYAFSSSGGVAYDSDIALIDSNTLAVAYMQTNSLILKTFDFDSSGSLTLKDEEVLLINNPSTYHEVELVYSSYTGELVVMYNQDFSGKDGFSLNKISVSTSGVLGSFSSSEDVTVATDNLRFLSMIHTRMNGLALAYTGDNSLSFNTYLKTYATGVGFYNTDSTVFASDMPLSHDLGYDYSSDKLFVTSKNLYDAVWFSRLNRVGLSSIYTFSSSESNLASSDLAISSNGCAVISLGGTGGVVAKSYGLNISSTFTNIDDYNYPIPYPDSQSLIVPVDEDTFAVLHNSNIVDQTGISTFNIDSSCEFDPEITYTGSYSSPASVNVVNVSSSITNVGDNWTIQCVASNGAYNGSAVNNSILVENQVPSMVNVSTLPSVTVLDNESIAGYCNASDADSHDLMFYYSWYENGVLNSSGTTTYSSSGTNVLVDTLDSSYLSPGNSWELECIASDGYDNSTALSSGQVYVNWSNHLPEVVEVVILPNPLYTNDTLVGYCNATDFDGDDVSYQAIWYYPNGTAIQVSSLGLIYDESLLININNLSSGFTSSGDLMTLSCRASDDGGVSWGNWTNGTITVSNTAPEADYAAITPVNPLDSTDLQGWCGDYDLDGDNLTYYYEWYQNGLLSTSGYFSTSNPYSLAVNVNNLSNSATTSGDNWTLSCLAFDGEANGTWHNSSNVTILAVNNAPVTINSSISPSSPDNDTSLIGSCNATDADGDTVLYQHIWYQNAAQYGAGTTSYYTQGVTTGVSSVPPINTSVGDSWILSCRAYDGNNYSSWMNSSSVTITAVNNTPIMINAKILPLTFYNNETLEGYCLGDDNNGDNLTYYWQWYNGSTLYSSGNTSPNTYTPYLSINVNNISNTTTATGESWTLSCLASDGTYNSTWMNSSTASINEGPTAPTTTTWIVTNGTQLSNETMQGWCNATDVNGDTVTYDWYWTVDGVTYDTGYYLSETSGISLSYLMNDSTNASQPQSLVVVGDYLYVATYDSIVSFNASSMVALDELTNVNFVDLYELAIIDNDYLAVVSSSNSHLLTINITDPNSLSVVDTYDLSSSGNQDLEISSEGIAFIADPNNNAVAFFNLSDPANIVYEGIYVNFTYEFQELALKENNILFASQGSGNKIAVINVSDLSSPELITDYTNNFYYVFYDLYYEDGKLFSAGDAASGSNVFVEMIGVSDLTNITSLALVNKTAGNGTYKDLYLANNNLLYASREGGLDVFDLSNPNNALAVHELNTTIGGGSYEELFVAGDYLYVLETDSNLTIVYEGAQSTRTLVSQGVAVNPSNISANETADDQEWYFYCSATDITGLAGSTTNDSTIIYTYNPNFAPANINASVVPEPTTITNVSLQGYCNATDSNGDNVSYYYTWYNGSSIHSSGFSNNAGLGYVQGVNTLLSTISSNDTVHFENWTFSCKATDGSLNSSYDNSTGTYINNSAPETSEPSLSNYAPLQTNTIYCYSANATDLDNDSIFWNFQWYNGSNLLSGEDTYILDLSSYSWIGGEQIVCSAQANDSFTTSSWYNSTAATLVLNTAPVVNEAYILPSGPYTNNTLYGYCNASDSETPIHYLYSWYVDGSLFSNGTLFAGQEFFEGWNKTLHDGSSGYDVYDIEIDADNYVYVAGVGANIVGVSSSSDSVIRKFHMDGTEITTGGWPIEIDYNNGKDTVFGIDIQGDYLYATGNTFNLANPPSSQDGFLKKYTLDGLEIVGGWNKTVDYSALPNGLYRVAVNPANNDLFVAGTARNLISGSSENDWVIKKYSEDGVEDTTNWNKSFDGNSGSDAIYAIVVDPATDNVYVAGGGFNIVGATNNDWWIKKFDVSTGTEDAVNWDKKINFGTGGTDYVQAIDFDSDGNVYFAGQCSTVTTSNDWCVKKFYPNGTEIVSGWNKTITSAGSNADLAYDLKIDSEDNIYIAGRGHALVNASTSGDYWMKKFYTNGTEEVTYGDWSWDYDLGIDTIKAITIDSYGYVYVSGDVKISSVSYWGLKKVNPYFLTSTEYFITSVQYSNTSHFDNWTFSCQAYDGTFYSSELNDSEVVLNFIPTTTNPSLNDTTPLVSDIILCQNSTSYDLDPEDTVTWNYTWYLNGSTISGQTNNTLDLSTTAANEGDNITCGISAWDGYDNSVWYNSTNYALVGGSAPIVSNVQISPDPLHDSNDATCTWTYSDPNSDPENGSTVTWYVNSLLITSTTYSAGDSYPVLLHTNYTAGDEVTCSVLGSDGSFNSSSAVSDSIIVSDNIGGGGGGGGSTITSSSSGSELLWPYTIGDGVCQYSLGENKIISPNDCRPGISDYVGCAINDYRCFDKKMAGDTKVGLIVCFLLIVLVAYLIEQRYYSYEKKK